jgi:hypothetical protein
MCRMTENVHEVRKYSHGVGKIMFTDLKKSKFTDSKKKSWGPEIVRGIFEKMFMCSKEIFTV